MGNRTSAPCTEMRFLILHTLFILTLFLQSYKKELPSARRLLFFTALDPVSQSQAIVLYPADFTTSPSHTNMTKGVASLLLAMVASLAMVVVAEQQAAIPGCESCTSPGCFIDGYDSSIKLDEVDQADSGVRKFQPETTYDATAQLVATFSDSNVPMFPALGRIANYYDTDLLLEIDYDGNDDLDLGAKKSKPDVQFLKIAAKQTCSAFLADKHTSGDISSVIAFTKEDVE